MSIPYAALRFNENRDDTINIDIIKAILQSAQEAWIAESIDGVMDKYAQDVVYTSNTGGPNGELLTIRGKDELRRRFESAMSAVKSRARFESVRCEDGIVRIRLTAVFFHPPTGHSMKSTVRQILRFENFRIIEQHDFHDAPKMLAFWKLVGDPLSQTRAQVRPAPETHPNVKAKA